MPAEICRFSGRATRPEYWWWVLAVVIGSVICSGVDSFVGYWVSSGKPGFASSVFQLLFTLVTLLPGLAVTVRRLHDIGRTGWWLLFWYGILIVGWIPMAVGFAVFIATIIGAVTQGFDLGGVFDGDFGSGSDSESLAVGLVALAVGFLISMAVTLGVFIWSVIWLVRQGQTGPNRFGPDPRAWDAAV